MKYFVNIVMNESLDHDLCYISGKSRDGNHTYLYIYTNGNHKIDFKNINFISFDKTNYKNVINEFRSKRKARENTSLVYLSSYKPPKKNTREENETLVGVLEKNPVFRSKRSFVKIGTPNFNTADIESVKPFRKSKNSLISFTKDLMYCSIDEIENTYEIINEIVRRVQKYEFSPAESLLYVYDIVRTNFGCDKKYNKMMKNIIKKYSEPSTFYGCLFHQVLDRIKINNILTVGDFKYSNFNSYDRVMNIVYLKDEEKEIEGIYYFDLTFNSRYAFEKTFPGGMGEDVYFSQFLNNYSSFCRTKEEMEYDLGLEEDSILGMADSRFIYEKLKPSFEENGVKGIFDFMFTINQLSTLVEGEKLLDLKRGIKPDEVEEVMNSVSEYISLMDRELSAEKFLDVLFSVRKVEYVEKGNIFPLDIESLKDCLLNSSFEFASLNGQIIDADTKEEAEEEYLKLFEYAFEDETEKHEMEDEIYRIKLLLKRMNRHDNDDNK